MFFPVFFESASVVVRCALNWKSHFTCVLTSCVLPWYYNLHGWLCAKYQVNNCLILDRSCHTWRRSTPSSSSSSPPHLQRHRLGPQGQCDAQWWRACLRRWGLLRCATMSRQSMRRGGTVKWSRPRRQTSIPSSLCPTRPPVLMRYLSTCSACLMLCTVIHWPMKCKKKCIGPYHLGCMWRARIQISWKNWCCSGLQKTFRASTT